MTQILSVANETEKNGIGNAVEKSSREVKLTLKELCHAANVSERTVRYYIQQGILPSPQRAGPASRYSLEHLSRLALVRRLKAALLPLNEIKHLMSEVPTSELEQVAYEFYQELTSTNPVATDTPRPLVRAARVRPNGAVSKGLTELTVFVPPEVEEGQAEPSNPAKSEKDELPLKGPVSAGRWQRVALAAGLELHYEEGGTHDTAAGQEKLTRLLELARQLYAE